MGQTITNLFPVLRALSRPHFVLPLQADSVQVGGMVLAGEEGCRVHQAGQFKLI